MELQLIQTLAGKLGVNEPCTMRKAQELLRIMNFKTATLNLTETLKVVFALDLASLALKKYCDRNIAIKLSGVKKKAYLSNLYVVQEICQVNNDVSIQDVCIQFGCMSAMKLACEILKKYENDTADSTCSIQTDCNRNINIVACIFMACRKHKVKVDRNKLIEVGKTNKRIFERLCSTLEKYVEESEKCSSPEPVSFLESMTEEHEEPSTSVKKRKIGDGNDRFDDYEEWKKKLLSATDSPVK